MIKNALVFFSIAFIWSCAPTRFVKPLDKGEQAVNLSLGGAVIGYSSFAIPMPFLTATYGYGIDSSLTGFASLNITSAIYGNLQTELGITKRLWKQHAGLPAVSINPVVNFMYRNKNAVKLYPQLDLNAYWELNRGRSFLYTGISNWFELFSTRALNTQQEDHWFLSPFIGETLVRKHWNYNLEAKFLAPYISSEKGIIDYKTFYGKHGAFGIYIGVTRKF